MRPNADSFGGGNNHCERDDFRNPPAGDVVFLHKV